MIIAMSVIILLAVGSDYNLLLVSRFKEEIHAGIKTGIIRVDGRHRRGGDLCRPGVRLHHDRRWWSVICASSARSARTIGLGLLFDTLVVRSFMTPSIAALLGRWFWWPQRVRTRPVPSPWPSPRTREDLPLGLEGAHH